MTTYLNIIILEESMKNMKSCKGCNTPQESRFYGKIWLSEDGYCSVCNVKYGDRPRTKSIFEFTTIKEGSNNHLTTWGSKETDYSILRKKIKHHYKQGIANQIVKDTLESKNRKITDY